MLNSLMYIIRDKCHLRLLGVGMGHTLTNSNIPLFDRRVLTDRIYDIVALILAKPKSTHTLLMTL